MCGIAGVFSVERPVDCDLVAAVLRMLDHQIHRGPNDWGLLLPDAAMRDQSIRGLLESRGIEHICTYPGSASTPAAVIGARRLSILDLSSQGRMPMGSADGKVWVTYNGEIYNFAELRAELKTLGVHFRSSGDTETLLNGFIAWGPDVVHRLRGMFAFAVFDVRNASNPKLFIARDRIGIKPLYWGRHRGTFQFASEVRALMAGRLMPNEPEPRGFHGFLNYGSVPTPWTTVRDVLALPPAHTLTLDEGSYSFPTPQRYWTLPAEGSRHINRADAIEEVSAGLDETVRLHLASDVPLGIFLSGGMDSSALVALASRQLSAPPTTLTVTFDEADVSEGAVAAETAKRYGTNHIEVRLRQNEFLGDLEAFLSSMDQPTIDGLNTWVVAKAARRAGLTVVLSGVGGDEVFHGYPGFQWAPRLARAMRVPGSALLTKLLGRIARAIGRPRFEKLEFLSEHPVLGPYLAIRGLFPPRRTATLLGCGSLPLWVGNSDVTKLTAGSYARVEIEHYLEHQLLRDTDVFGMAHSMEVRVPFLDHRFMELVMALPRNHLTDGIGQKPLLRSALGYAGIRVATREKVGFTLPLDRWLRQRWPEVETATAYGELNLPQGLILARQFQAGRVHWSRPWALAVLHNLRRRQELPNFQTRHRLRILFLLSQVTGTGGIPRYNRGLLRAASEAAPEAELIVVSVNDTLSPTDPQLLGRLRFRGAGPRQAMLHKLRVVAYATAACLSRRPSVIVCGHINLMPLTWVLAQLIHARTLLIAHGIEVWNPHGILPLAARRASRVLPVSRHTAARVLALGIAEERVTILPNSVDGDVYRPVNCREAAAPHVLTVCRLDASEQYKGVDRIFEALADLRAQGTAIHHVVVGDGDDLPRLKELVTSLKIDDIVKFDGFVDECALPRTYSRADVFAMPSSKEGFGIVFLEALACGTPVIAGNRDGSVDALLDGELGSLVNPDDIEALAAAIALNLNGGSGRTRSDRYKLRANAIKAYGFDRFRSRVAQILVN